MRLQQRRQYLSDTVDGSQFSLSTVSCDTQYRLVRGFGLIFLALAAALIPYFAMLVHLIEFTMSVGVSRTISVVAVSIVGAFNILVKVFAGWVADSIGILQTLSGCVLLMSTRMVMLIVIPTSLGILFSASLFGLEVSGIATLISPLLADTFGAKDLGTMFGTVSLTFAITVHWLRMGLV